VSPTNVQFDSALDAFPAQLWSALPNGSIDFLNQTWLNYTGLTLEQAQGRGWGQSLHPDDIQITRQRWAQAVESRSNFEAEGRLRCHDGTYHWFLCRAHLVFDQAGQPLRWYGTNTEITESKQAVLTLRKYKMAVEQSPLSIAITNAAAEIEYVNPRFTELTGYRMEDALGQNPRILKSGITSPDEYKRMWDILVAGETWHGEFHNRKKNGELYWESASISPIQDENGVITHYVAVKENITERKRDQERIAETIEFTQTILEVSPIGILIFKDSGQSISANQAACDILGGSKEALLALNFHTLQTWKTTGLYDAALQALLTNSPVRCPIHSVNSFNRELWLGVTIAPFITGGERHLLVMLSDDSKQQQAEARLVAAQAELERRVEVRTAQLQAAYEALEKASRAKDEFLAAMSHELRTPLTSILGLSEALQSEYFGSLNERQLKGIQTIERGGRRLNELISKVLDYTRIQAGRLALQKDLYNLNELCRSSLQAVKSFAAEKNHQVEYVGVPENIQIKVDKHRIQQALINLLDNAIKFSPPDGQIRLAAAILEPGDWFQISVSDNGIGIRPDDTASIFDPFIQADSRLSREYNGSGLGLALVKSIVELHGGRVEVHSQLGQGSTFVVTLPIEPAA